MSTDAPPAFRIRSRKKGLRNFSLSVEGSPDNDGREKAPVKQEDQLVDFIYEDLMASPAKNSSSVTPSARPHKPSSTPEKESTSHAGNV